MLDDLNKDNYQKLDLPTETVKTPKFYMSQ